MARALVVLVLLGSRAMADAHALVRKGRTGDLAQAEARYVAGDGTAVLAVASWEAGLPAMKLEDAMPRGVDVTTKKPVTCAFETIGATRALSCSSYGAYFRSTQWNRHEASVVVTTAATPALSRLQPMAVSAPQARLKMSSVRSPKGPPCSCSWSSCSVAAAAGAADSVYEAMPAFDATRRSVSRFVFVGSNSTKRRREPKATEAWSTPG